MNAQKVRNIFLRFKKANPNPTTELKYRTPFELLVAVILSAQSTDRGVNLATARLFKVANTPEKMLALGSEQLKTYIQTIGLYHSKAKNLIASCELLVKQFHSQVPKNREALQSLPGVGRKTANVILNTCFGEPTLAVDTHVLRIANRIGLVKAKTPIEVEKQLMTVIPKTFLHNAHHWLILHGRYVCVARKPRCPFCLIKDLCEYQHKTPLAAFSEKEIAKMKTHA